MDPARSSDCGMLGWWILAVDGLIIVWRNWNSEKLQSLVLLHLDGKNGPSSAVSVLFTLDVLWYLCRVLCV